MSRNILSLYKKSSIRSLFWVGSSKAFARGFTLIRTLILARLLMPADFGAYGIALLALSAAETFTQTGINVVLIQEKDEDIDRFISTAWLVSIARGFLIGAIILSSAPILSSFFKSPDTLRLLVLVSIVPMVRGFINPSIIKFEKQLRFHMDFIVRGGSLIVDSVIALSIVYLTRSPQGLMLGLLAGAMSEVIISFVLAKPIPKFSFEKEKFSRVVSKGKWVTAFAGFDFLSTQLDNIAVGRILNVASLGYYQMAYRISILPISEISDIFNRVAFPLYSGMVENRRKLLETFLKVQVSVSVIVIPVCFLIFLFPREIMQILLGDKWIAAAPALRILALYGGLRAISGATSSFFLSLNLQKFVATITFVRFLGLAITIVPLTLRFGILGASYSALFSALVELPIILFFLFTVIFRKNTRVA